MGHERLLRPGEGIKPSAQSNDILAGRSFAHILRSVDATSLS